MRSGLKIFAIASGLTFLCVGTASAGGQGSGYL